jgi:hypothetical protein
MVYDKGEKLQASFSLNDACFVLYPLFTSHLTTILLKVSPLVMKVKPLLCRVFKQSNIR